mmetsp:Transcript_10191/g.24937  ORF Transcript_10191/g.24937 Transcript_10191/m.24937 type:complete len:338 (+) Transcript_10191:128-1141(+)
MHSPIACANVLRLVYPGAAFPVQFRPDVAWYRLILIRRGNPCLAGVSHLVLLLLGTRALTRHRFRPIPRLHRGVGHLLDPLHPAEHDRPSLGLLHHVRFLHALEARPHTAPRRSLALGRCVHRFHLANEFHPDDFPGLSPRLKFGLAVARHIQARLDHLPGGLGRPGIRPELGQRRVVELTQKAGNHGEALGLALEVSVGKCLCSSGFNLGSRHLRILHLHGSALSAFGGSSRNSGSGGDSGLGGGGGFGEGGSLLGSLDCFGFLRCGQRLGECRLLAPHHRHSSCARVGGGVHGIRRRCRHGAYELLVSVGDGSPGAPRGALERVRAHHARHLPRD